MGAVYRAHDPELDRDVAVKVLHHTDWRAQQRMRREAQAMASLSHPNVLPVYDVAEHDGRLFIAMELVEGQNLRQWLAKPGRSWEEIVRTFIEAGRGLDAAHEAGFVHRDFKPANVLVGDDGRVRVMDFGLARPLTEDSELDSSMATLAVPDGTAVTEEGMVVGTPPYMAPEQFMSGPIDRAADQYGFCVALWEGLAGQRPWDGINDRRKLLAIKLRGAPDASVALATMPRSIQDAVERGLSAEPESRFPSMQSLLAAIEPPEERSNSRAVLGVSLVGAVLVIGGLGIASSSDEEEEPTVACEEAERWIGATWDDAARTRAREGLLATEVSYAPETWPLLEERLDGYVARWVESHRAACVAAEAQERGADARLRCLGDGRRALDALVRAFGEADETTLSLAISAVDRLPEPLQCADAAERLHELPLPTDPEQLAAVERAKEQLAWVRALSQLGRYGDAVERGRVLLGEVEPLGHPPLSIDVALVLGKAISADRQSGGVELLERAYFDARTHGLERRAVRAALLLVRYLGVTLEQGDAATQWIEHAQGVVERLSDPYLRADFHVVVGEAHHSAGRTAEAIEHKERALELARELYPPTHRAVAVAQSGLGTIYDMTGRLDEALALAQQAKAIVVESSGPRHPDVAQLLHSVGHAQLALGALDEARASFELAREINEEVFGPEHTRVAGSLNNLATVETRSKHYGRAVDLLERSLRIREEVMGPEHPLVARVLVNLGEAYQGRGRSEEAIEALDRAGRIVEQAYGRTHEIMVAVVAARGSIAAAAGHPQEASTWFETGAELAEAVYGPEHQTTQKFREGVEAMREQQSQEPMAGDEAKDSRASRRE